MKVDYFGTRSGAIPVLVDIFDTQDLYALAKNKTPQAREDLANKIVALLDVSLSMREKELVADILIDLMRQAEHDLRMAIAERLATMDDIPLRLILAVASDDIEIAAPVLEHSPMLNELDLIYIIKGKTADHWRAIAKRDAMTDDIITMLAQTKDIETAINLAENECITLSGAALSVVADMAREHNDLAVPLLRRTDVPKDIAQAVYKHVNTQIKAQFGEKFAPHMDTINVVADTVEQEFIQMSNKGAQKDMRIPTGQDVQVAKAALNKGLLSANLLIETLKRKQSALFVAQFCLFCKTPVKVALKILEETSGQKLAIIAKAYDISQTDFIAIFTLSAYMRGHNDVVQTEDIQKAAEHYKMIGKAAAKQLIKSL